MTHFPEATSKEKTRTVACPGYAITEVELLPLDCVSNNDEASASPAGNLDVIARGESIATEGNPRATIDLLVHANGRRRAAVLHDIRRRGGTVRTVWIIGVHCASAAASIVIARGFAHSGCALVAIISAVFVR